jgi:hypothetical protein
MGIPESLDLSTVDIGRQNMGLMNIWGQTHNDMAYRNMEARGIRILLNSINQ